MWEEEGKLDNFFFWLGRHCGDTYFLKGVVVIVVVITVLSIFDLAVF